MPDHERCDGVGVRACDVDAPGTEIYDRCVDIELSAVDEVLVFSRSFRLLYQTTYSCLLCDKPAIAASRMALLSACTAFMKDVTLSTGNPPCTSMYALTSDSNSGMPTLSNAVQMAGFVARSIAGETPLGGNISMEAG